jgi:hypothetical protein
MRKYMTGYEMGICGRNFKINFLIDARLIPSPGYAHCGA